VASASKPKKVGTLPGWRRKIINRECWRLTGGHAGALARLMDEAAPNRLPT
jgi:hypothetical protein